MSRESIKTLEETISLLELVVYEQGKRISQLESYALLADETYARKKGHEGGNPAAITMSGPDLAFNVSLCDSEAELDAMLEQREEKPEKRKKARIVFKVLKSFSEKISKNLLDPAFTAFLASLFSMSSNKKKNDIGGGDIN